jgi:UDP-glucose 4-epimerase
MSNILVLGANGYIGKNISFYIKNNTTENVVLGDIASKSMLDFENYYKVDVLDLMGNSRFLEILPAIDSVFYFAGRTGTIDSIVNYSRYISINQIGLLNFLDFLRINKLRPKIIFPSTRLIYKGRDNALLKEDDEKECKTIYAVDKYACENYLRIFNIMYEIPYSIFRICVPYGNLVDDSYSYGTVGAFLQNARKKEKLTIYGDGKQKRSLIHIYDLVKVMYEFSSNRKSDNECFNIGGPDIYSIKEIAQNIAVKHGVGIEYENWKDEYLKIESGDTVFDDSKIKSLINIDYTYSFSKWLESK